MSDIQIVLLPDRGRAVLANRAFRAGELIWSETAFLISRLPLLQAARGGYNAFVADDSNSSPLLNSADHAEIDHLCRAANVFPLLVHFLLRLWDQPCDSDASAGRQLRALYYPVDGVRSDWVPLIERALTCLPQSVLDRTTPEQRSMQPGSTITFARLFAAHDANCYESADDGCAEVFAVQCAMNHSCSPNVYAHRPRAGYVELRAVRPISVGEEIQVSYLGDMEFLGARQRRFGLLSTKGFQCNCQRCQSPCWLRSFRCPLCQQESVSAPPGDDVDAVVTFTCCVKDCKFSARSDSDSAKLLYSAERRAQIMLDELENGNSDIGFAQEALTAAEKALARGHWIIRRILLCIRSLLMSSKPARVVPAARVQVRAMASLACGLLGRRALEICSAESHSIDGPAARSALVDPIAHCLFFTTLQQYPSFEAASQAEQLADLLSLIANGLKAQEEQQNTVANGPLSSIAVYSDVGIYWTQAAKLFELLCGRESAEATRLRSKLAQIRQFRGEEIDAICLSLNFDLLSVEIATSVAPRVVFESAPAKLLREISSDIFSGLQELDLAKRNLTELPSAIGSLIQLRKINAAHNPLKALPESMASLVNLETLFFLGCQFEQFPEFLGDLPRIRMVSFKCNRLNYISERALSPSLVWLILTDNKLEQLPAALGRLPRLRKLMLATNQLLSLPDMSGCQSLELIRLSDNQLSRAAIRKSGVLNLSRLAWIAMAGNQVETLSTAQQLESAGLPSSMVLRSEFPVLGNVLGEGASGTVYQAVHHGIEVAVKVFKLSSSDGRAVDEIRAAVTVTAHPCLVDVLAAYVQPQQSENHHVNASAGRLSLVMKLLDGAKWLNLGGPPSFASVTRDAFPDSLRLSRRRVLAISRDVCSACRHSHACGVAHGDIYTHNTLYRPDIPESRLHDEVVAIIGDFGAGFVIADCEQPDQAQPMCHRMESIEVRAFGCLIDDLLAVAQRVAVADSEEERIESALRVISDECCREDDINARPTFAEVEAKIRSIAF